MMTFNTFSKNKFLIFGGLIAILLSIFYANIITFLKNKYINNKVNKKELCPLMPPNLRKINYLI
jgi:hypothetical protein